MSEHEESFKVVDRRGEAKEETPPDQIVDQPAPELQPRCGYCGLDPCLPRTRSVASMSFSAVLMFCPNPACRAIFNVQITNVTRPTVPAMPQPGDALQK